MPVQAAELVEEYDGYDECAHACGSEKPSDDDTQRAYPKVYSVFGVAFFDVLVDFVQLVYVQLLTFCVFRWGCYTF